MSTVYDIVTEQIVNALEKGTVPWKKPWTTGCPMINGQPVLNQNLFTKKAYRGVNMLLTSLAPFASPFWVPKGEIKKRNLTIKEGESYTPIVYFKWRSKEELAKATAAGESKAPCFLRFFQVWNSDQLEGVEDLLPKLDEVEVQDNKPIDAASVVVKNYSKKPKIDHVGDQACYNVMSDLIKMPALEAFFTPEAYHGTLFHELVHATGHKKRLSRDTLVDYAPFGSQTYSKEELVAEIGSCFLCATVGIETPQTFENSAAYISGWLEKIKKDSRLIVSAAQQAQKAVDHILETKFDNK